MNFVSHRHCWRRETNHEAKKLCGGEFFHVRSQNRVPDSQRVADRLKRAFTRVKQSSVAHGASDSPRPSDDLRVAAGGSQYTVDSSVEHRDDLGQARNDGDFTDARKQLAEHEVDAVP